MATLAQRQKWSEMREYFREHWAGKVNNVNDCRQDMQRRFGLDDQKWYSLRLQLKDIMSQSPASRQAIIEQAAQPEPLDDPGEVVIEIPAHLNGEAQSVLNKLLSENHRLVHEATLKDVEIAARRGELGQKEARIRLLKRIVNEILEAM